jgi:hypothetical protein
VQWIGTAYDSGSWDRHDGFDVRVIRSIDEPQWRDRLWSIADNPIAFYWCHRSEAIALREESLAQFARTPFEVRRPTP